MCELEVSGICCYGETNLIVLDDGRQACKYCAEFISPIPASETTYPPVATTKPLNPLLTETPYVAMVTNFGPIHGSG